MNDLFYTRLAVLLDSDDAPDVQAARVLDLLGEYQIEWRIYRSFNTRNTYGPTLCRIGSQDEPYVDAGKTWYEAVFYAARKLRR